MQAKDDAARAAERGDSARSNASRKGGRVRRRDKGKRHKNALGRKKEEDITIADLTGLATQDIAIAGTILLGDKHKDNNNAES